MESVKMFAVHIIFNEKGKKKVGESLQCHITTIEGLSEKLEQYDIKSEHIKAIEIIDSKHWKGWRN